MAKATKVVEKVEITTIKEEQTGVLLHLDMEEAHMLRALLGECMHGMSSQVFDALLQAGAERGRYKVEDSFGKPLPALNIVKVE